MVRCPELFSNSVMLILENRSIRFKFSPFERNAACENQSDSPDIFGLFEAESSLGQDDCWEELMRLETFLTFTRGAKCGFGHVCGHSSDGSIAFAWIGFSSFDLNQPLLGWYDWSLQNELPNIFSQFCEIPMDSLLYKAIHHSIYYYRSSNVARSDYLEMAIIASHAALEVLVHYILEERAGWSSEMMKGKLKSADMLRAACHFCGVTAEPLEHSVELLKIAKNRSIDGYELVHTIRNRLVHASKAPEFEGRALLESWTVSQWMVELLIFYLIGYRGKMADRREISRWKGTTVDVPLT